MTDPIRSLIYWVQPIGALFAVGSLLTDQGVLAAALALPWVVGQRGSQSGSFPRRISRVPEQEDIGGFCPHDPTAICNAGGVHVLNGSSTGITLTGNIYFTQTGVDGATDGDAETDDEFGKNLQVGDFNSDAFTDLALGTWQETLNGVCESGGICQAGILEVVYGPISAASLAAAQYWDQAVIGNPDDTNGAHAFDRFGWFG